MLLPKDSPVKYWLLAKEFSSLLPIDSDRSAQGHVVLSFLASIRVMEMNTLSQVQKHPTFQKSWDVKIILRPYISNNCNIPMSMFLHFYLVEFLCLCKNSRMAHTKKQNQPTNSVENVWSCTRNPAIQFCMSQAWPVFVIIGIKEGILGWMFWSRVSLFRNRHEISMLHYWCSGKPFVFSTDWFK